jgi:N-acetylmuramoyl-L-alanine amidase
MWVCDIKRLLLAAFIAIALWGSAAIQEAQAAQVRSVRWENHGTYLRLTVELSQAVKSNVRNEIAQKRLFYVDLSHITKGVKNFPPPPGGMGVRRVQSSYYPSHDLQRFVFYVDPDVKFEVTNLVLPSRLVIDITHGSKSLSINSARKKVVVIDPGHGGMSTGARSRSKVKGKYLWEKDIVMQYCLRLEKLINASPNMRAVLTRRNDTYVSLTGRIDKAVKAEGDLFISVHCNSVPGTRPSKASGLEIWTWSDKGTSSAAHKFLISLENDEEVTLRVNGKHDKELKQVLGTMMGDMLDQQKSLSSLLAQQVYGNMLKVSYYKSRGRGIKSARFKVLENYEMPAILIELGFMPNPTEVKKLADPRFQRESTTAIFNGINAYFAKADKTFSPRFINLASVNK